METTRLMNHENAVVFDVRSEADFNRDHILNAINLPEAEIESRQQELKKYENRIIITCCNNGAISTRVARDLKTNGFEQAYCLKGGLLAWQNASLPLTHD